MTKSNNEWVPELKEECGIEVREEDGMSHIRWGKMEYLGSKYLIFRDQLGDDLVFESGNVIGFLPIKTEAEKRRESMLEDMVFNVPRYEYEHLHVVKKIVNHTCNALIDAGYIKPKPLTEKVVFELITVGLECKVIAERLNAYICGDLKS